VYGCRLIQLTILASLILPFLASCHQITVDDPAAPLEPPGPASVDFDADQCGLITGQVHWDSEPPKQETISAWLSAEGGTQVTVPNPLVPDIQRGLVRGAIVFLRGVDARKARPWSHAPVAILQEEYQIRIQQDNETSPIGFVRRGDNIEMVSRQPVFHSLHLSGATFATIAFPDPDVVRKRRLDRRGLVELSSAAGYYWARAFVFVDDHPYFTRTDAEGRFRFDDVPQGEYEIVCWLPGWRAIRHTRDPESALISRQEIEPPIEIVHHIIVDRKKIIDVPFTMSASPSVR